MKLLFITHCHGNYGASKSLQLLLRNLVGHQITLIVPKGIRVKNNLEEIKEFYGKNVSEIKEFHLPFKYCYMGCPDLFIQKASNMAINLLYKITSKRLIKYIEENDFDLIHLNAPVLYPVINPDMPFIVHMRDVMLMEQEYAVKKVLQSRGIIFIDPGTREPFKDKAIKNEIVLNNPFDMTTLGNYDESQILDEYGIGSDSLIFSCIGRIKESKGVEFVIESFLKSRDNRKILLIFGKGDSGSDYEERCKLMALNDARIRFIGEEKDIAKVYRISDYIIRGDPWHLIGRTVFEGLYSGCDVILPGDDSDLERNPDLNYFKDKLHLYSPRNVDALTLRIDSISSKVKNRGFRSNVNEYVNKFNQFIKKVIATDFTDKN